MSPWNDCEGLGYPSICNRFATGVTSCFQHNVVLNGAWACSRSSAGYLGRPHPLDRFGSGLLLTTALFSYKTSPGYLVDRPWTIWIPPAVDDRSGMGANPLPVSPLRSRCSRDVDVDEKDHCPSNRNADSDDDRTTPSERVGELKVCFFAPASKPVPP